MSETLPAKFVVPLDLMTAESSEEINLLLRLAVEAREYLAGFPWCRGIQALYFGNGVGGIVGVFLARIQPSSPDVDEWLWVVAGDLPPAYLVLDNGCDRPSEALDTYLDHMAEWVSAVFAGSSVEDLIPVNVPPTQEWATRLKGRLETLRNVILPRFKDDEGTIDRQPKPGGSPGPVGPVGSA